MKLFMTLLVRNEEDILEANLRFHRDQGVDHFVITDNLSTDATPDIIAKYVDAGLATCLREESDDYSQSTWVTRMASVAHRMGAHWIVHADADEFWLSTGSGTLAATLARTWWANVAVAERRDFVALDPPSTPFWQSMVFRKVTSSSPTGMPLLPKVAHRAARRVRVAQGNHAVATRYPQVKAGGRIEILHFPLRSREQYLRKIELGGAAYARNATLPAHVGDTWRKQHAELAATGDLRYVRDNTVTHDRARTLASRGDLVEDLRLVQAMMRIEQRLA